MSEKDDRRMKELADRLVAMSPEPPPFPEEVTVTQPRGSRPSPIMMFAGAAVIVLILAAIPILLVGNGGNVDPIATTTTSTVPSTVTSEETVTTGEATTTTAIPMEGANAVLYLVQSPGNPVTGNPTLVPFRTSVPTSSPIEPLEEAMLGLTLLTDPSLSVPEGFTTSIPFGLGMSMETRPEEHLIILDMNEAFLAGGGGLLADFTMLNQIIYTATQIGEIESVLFTVGGGPVTAFGSEGLDLSEPVGRDSFLGQLNSVLVTSPVNGEGDSPLMVSGVANVFEATVSLEVVDGGGNVVHEEFATATCGTGCWGAYTFDVDYPFTGEESIRVFWHSPEDGEPADVVTVPVLWDDEDGWDLLTEG
jgi:spore germination protein GerM